MNKLQNNKLKSKLEELKTTSKPLKKYVVEYVLEEFNNYDDIKDFFKDLSYGGCSSGMISDLIYYKDTSDFFDNYEDEIEDLITLNMDRFGIETRPLFINSLNGSAENIAQEKNLLSWFAFEEVARDLSEELGFETNQSIQDYFNIEPVDDEHKQAEQQLSLALKGIKNV